MADTEMLHTNIFIIRHKIVGITSQNKSDDFDESFKQSLQRENQVIYSYFQSTSTHNLEA